MLASPLLTWSGKPITGPSISGANGVSHYLYVKKIPIHLSCRHSGTHGDFRGAKPAYTLSPPVRPIVGVNDAVIERYSLCILITWLLEPPSPIGPLSQRAGTISSPRVSRNG